VIITGEKNNKVPTSDGARQAHGAHHRFRAGVAEGDALHAGKFTDQLRALANNLSLRTDRETELHLFVQCIENEIWRVAIENRPISIQNVDVAIAILIPQISAFCALDNYGINDLLKLRVETGDDAAVSEDRAMLLREGL